MIPLTFEELRAVCAEVADEFLRLQAHAPDTNALGFAEAYLRLRVGLDDSLTVPRPEWAKLVQGPVTAWVVGTMGFHGIRAVRVQVHPPWEVIQEPAWEAGHPRVAVFAATGATWEEAQERARQGCVERYPDFARFLDA